MYQSYGADETSLVSLAKFAAQHGMIEQSKNLYVDSDEDFVYRDELAIWLLRSYLEAGEYRQGIEFASTMSNLNEQLRMYFDSSLVYAYFALEMDVQAELQLKSFRQFAE